MSTPSLLLLTTLLPQAVTTGHMQPQLPGKTNLAVYMVNMLLNTLDKYPVTLQCSSPTKRPSRVRENVFLSRTMKNVLTSCENFPIR